MLKSYSREKITHIMDKNEVEFISAESSGFLLTVFSFMTHP